MLEVRDLAVDYGKIRAVQGVSFSVAEGEIVALIGANGAGKSSVMHAVSGVVKPSAGRVLFENDDITARPAHEIVSKGLAQVPEGRMIFTSLTIEENLEIGAYTAARADLSRRKAEVLEMFPVLRQRLGEGAAALSGGQQQMLALARGLMSGPKLLMLDEPSLGLSPIAAQEVFDLMVTLRSKGVTILLVEQNVRQALGIADRGYVVESGRQILEGTSRALLSNRLLISSYLGVKREDMAQ